MLTRYEPCGSTCSGRMFASASAFLKSLIVLASNGATFHARGDRVNTANALAPLRTARSTALASLVPLSDQIRVVSHWILFATQCVCERAVFNTLQHY
jgi:hypothetical protein